jgi:TP901-1 family phage major tail protein
MVYNGTLQIITMDGTQLAELTSVSMSMSQDLFDVTSKESAGWSEVLAGLRTITYNAEGIVDFQATNKDMADLWTAFTTRASVAIIFTNLVTGDKRITQTCYISNLEITAPMEDTVTYSVEFTGTGAPTVATIS